MRRILSTSLLLMALVSVAPARAAPAWQAQQGLTPERDVIDYRVAAAGHDEVLALALTSGARTGDRAELLRRPAGGVFGEPDVLDGTGPFGREHALGAGRSGHALALWTTQGDGAGETRLLGSFREPGGEPGPAQELPLGARQVYRVEAAIGPDGTALIALTSFLGGRSEVAALVRHPDGRVEGPTPLAPTDRHRSNALVAVDAAGNATFLWSRNQFGRSPGAVEMATRPAGGAFSTPVRISAPSENARRFPLLAVGPEGQAVAVWHVNLRGRGLRLRAAVRRIGRDHFDRPQTVSATGAGQSAAAAGPDGTLLIAYRQELRRGGPHRQRARFFSPRRGWLPSEVLSRARREVTDPNAGFDADGNAIVAWGRLDRRGAGAVEAALRSRRGRFGRSVRISESVARGRRDVALAVTPSGDAAVFWTRFGGGGPLRAALFTDG